MSVIPKTRADFWTTKFSRNVERDARAERLLRLAGWDVLVVWECETRDVEAIAARLGEFLGHRGIVPPTRHMPMQDVRKQTC